MIEQVPLERFKYAVMEMFPKEFIVDFSDSFDSYIRDTIAMRVTRMVYGHRLAEWSYEIQMPKNWWQHLKKNVGLRHYKTVRTTGQITRRRLYPDLPVLPANKAGVSYLVEDHVGY